MRYWRGTTRPGLAGGTGPDSAMTITIPTLYRNGQLSETSAALHVPPSPARRATAPPPVPASTWRQRVGRLDQGVLGRDGQPEVPVGQQRGGPAAAWPGSGWMNTVRAWMPRPGSAGAAPAMVASRPVGHHGQRAGHAAGDGVHGGSRGPAERLGGPGGPVRVVVVDHVGGAQRADPLGAARPGGGGDLDAGQRGELDHQAAGHPATAVDQELLPRPQAERVLA